MNRLILTWTLLLACVMPVFAAPAQLKISRDGTVEIGKSRLTCGFFSKQWQPFFNEKIEESHLQGDARKGIFSGKWRFSGREISFRQEYEFLSEDSLKLRYEITAPAGMELHSPRLILRIPVSTDLLCFDGKQEKLPAAPERQQLLSRQAKTISFHVEPEQRLLLRGSLFCVVQDSRKTGAGQSFTLNFGNATGQKNTNRFTSELTLSLEKIQMIPLPLEGAANRSFMDTPNSPGWTGQGAANDLRCIQSGPLESGVFRFQIGACAPGVNSAIVTGNRSDMKLARSSLLKLPKGSRGQALYLLHAYAWPPRKGDGTLELQVRFADDSMQLIPLSAQDCGNWHSPNRSWNAEPIWNSENDSAPVGLYASGFPLDRPDPIEVRFVNRMKNTVWMIAAVSLGNFSRHLSDHLRLDIVPKADREWLPVKFTGRIEPGSPLDFSWAVSHAPVGKFGFVRAAANGTLEFERAPGKPVRFFGVNLCMSANFIPHEAADRLAENLKRHGYNCVRLHHYDNDLTDYSSREEAAFHPEKLDQFDYLAAVLKKRGLYLTIDLHSSRRPAGMSAGFFKSSIAVSEHSMRLWKDFAKKLLTHKNPYTGLAWGEDPALMAIVLVNEDALREVWHGAPKLYRQAFEEWKKKRGIRTGIASNSDRIFLRFLHECQEKAIKEEIRFVREELKVKIPLTGSNFGNTFDLIPNRCRFDIVDNHYYYDHPTFPETQWMGMPEAHHQRSPIADNAALPARLLPRRVENKPFMVTEYNYCYPNIYRSCGGALMGGYAALQDHQALFRFAWAHHWTRAVGPASTSRFDSASDPLVQFTDRITSAAFLRGDVTPAQEKVILELEQQALFRDFPLQVSGRQAMLGLITATGCRMRDGRPGALPPEIAVSPEKLATRHPAVARNLAAAQRGEPIRSITGELTLEPKQNRFVINTPRLAVLSLENGSATAGMFTVSGVTMFTTAALISLDGKPLTDSRNILVLHLTNTLASDAVFSPDLRIVRKDGKQPLLVKRSSAEITLRTPALYSVQALAADGSVLGKLPGVRRGNSFCFTADTGCFPGGVMAYHLTR